MGLAVADPAFSAQKFGDWGLACEDRAACAIAQSLMAEDRSWLATVMMQPDAETSGALVQVIVPAGVHLASGLYFELGGSDALAARWLVCSPEDCRAELRLAAADLAAWKTGRAVQIRYRARLDGPVVAFDLSLMGVTAALDAAGGSR